MREVERRRATGSAKVEEQDGEMKGRIKDSMRAILGARAAAGGSSRRAGGLAPVTARAGS